MHAGVTDQGQLNGASQEQRDPDKLDNPSLTHC